jgi:hypothetical protein
MTAGSISLEWESVILPHPGLVRSEYAKHFFFSESWLSKFIQILLFVTWSPGQWIRKQINPLYAIPYVLRSVWTATMQWMRCSGAGYHNISSFRALIISSIEHQDFTLTLIETTCFLPFSMTEIISSLSNTIKDGKCTPTTMTKEDYIRPTRCYSTDLTRNRITWE